MLGRAEGVWRAFLCWCRSLVSVLPQCRTALPMVSDHSSRAGWDTALGRSLIRASLAHSWSTRSKAIVWLSSACCCLTKTPALSKLSDQFLKLYCQAIIRKNILSWISLATYFTSSPVFLWLVTLVWKPREQTRLCSTVDRKLSLMSCWWWNQLKSAKISAGFETHLDEIQVKPRNSLASLLRSHGKFTKLIVIKSLCDTRPYPIFNIFSLLWSQWPKTTLIPG